MACRVDDAARIHDRAMVALARALMSLRQVGMGTVIISAVVGFWSDGFGDRGVWLELSGQSRD
ncbi:hypothetical protein [Bradyrhizobium lablabi]|uniref:hypothetical protein n=1 Tax=Bradyrhizobium lablabi TaxID=722472 RepID=UPI001BAE4034|nr:hypothetical protein [Bradyrhizobium lablabi]MBR0697041.1 hypothetical protein [Bradyrhizobium lablabi]